MGGLALAPYVFIKIKREYKKFKESEIMSTTPLQTK